MIEDGGSMFAALADSWLGKGLATLALVFAGAFGGWWTSRANIMNAVTTKVNGLMDHYASELARVTLDHHACQEEVKGLHGQLEQMRGEVNGLKQTLASIEAAKRS